MGTMIQEAIQKIEELVKAGTKPVAFHPDCEPSHMYWLCHDGKAEQIEAIVSPRADRVFSLEALATLLVRCRAVDGEPVVYVGRGSVTAVVNDNGSRRERLKLDLPSSSEFETLVKMGSDRESADQGEFVNQLRIDLAGCIEPDIIELFRQIRATGDSEASGEIATGRESMGRRIRAEVQAGGRSIPDEIEVAVYVYRDLASSEYRMKLSCAVVVNCQEMTFALIPKAGELERVQRETDQYIVGDLQNRLPGTCVLLGRPLP